MSCLITVVVPVFNMERYVKECIDSILMQTYQDFELIVVNDGSTDKSMEIVTSYNDSRIVTINQENRGVSSARNAGLDAAKGRYLCFVDADDLIEQNFLQNMVELSDNTDSDIVFGGYKFLYDNGSIITKEQRIAPGKYKNTDFFDTCIDDGTLTGILFGSSCMNLYRTDVIKDNGIRFYENIKVNEDGIFNLELLKVSKKVYITTNANYLYRQWKKQKKNTVSFDSAELDKATSVLEELSSDFSAVTTQLTRRKISVYFWTAIKVGDSNLGLFRLRREVRLYAKTCDISAEDYRVLNFEEMNVYKKVLSSLLRYHCYTLFVIILKYIAPIMKRKVSH